MKSSGIKIVEVRIRNFRSLKSVDIGIDTLSIFVGANNSGKTSCLEALMFAMGYGAKPITDDDIYVGPGETSPPITRSIVIDILIKPIDDSRKVIDAFPSGSYWLILWGNGTSHDENDDEFMAFRTNYVWSKQKASYQVERKFLRDWRKDSSKLHESKTIDEAGLMSMKMIEPMALYYMDAKRDIDEDLKKHSSFWRKMTRDLIVTDEEKEELEKILTELNFKMIEKSEVLKHIKTHIDELKYFISTDTDGVNISPVPRTLRDIAKGIDINFTTEGAQSFPLSRHGMGTRSLAAILVFRAYMTWKIKQIGEDDIHSMLALEEPESHLHPQAQRALIDDMKKIPGQVIISTHSPYVSSKTSIEYIRCFFKEGSESYVSSMPSNKLNPKEIEKINREILNTRGDMLFARALVFFEGPTEEFALPIFATAYLEKNINHFGLSFVPVGGDTNYKPFLIMAKHFKIPWFVFSDGEKLAVERLERSINEIGLKDVSKQDNIVILPNELSFESYCVLKGHSGAVNTMLNEFHQSSDYLSDYIHQHHGKEGKNKIVRDYKSEGGQGRALIDILSANKVGYAQRLAHHILASKKERKIPEPIESLLDMVSKKIKVPEKRKTVKKTKVAKK